MSNEKYKQSIEDPLMNQVLTKYFDKLMPKEQKKIISTQMERIKYITNIQSRNRAKIGKKSSLEILYKLGKFLNNRK